MTTIARVVCSARMNGRTVGLALFAVLVLANTLPAGAQMTGAPAASAARPASTAPGEKTRSGAISGMPQA